MGIEIIFFHFRHAFNVFTCSIARSEKCRYLSYSEADFEVFRPAGATGCTDEVKFGVKEGTLPAKLHPHLCNDKGIGPLKLEFLLRFDQNMEYKRPAGVHPLRFSQKLQHFYSVLGCISYQNFVGFAQGFMK